MRPPRSLRLTPAAAHNRSDSCCGDSARGRKLRDDARSARACISSKQAGGPSEVYVRLDEGYGYTMDGDDFYDLMLDNIESTQTQRYTILEARWGSRGEASVLASHEFMDPWGRRQCVYHRYVLVEGSRGFRIAQFEVSQSRFRW